MKFLYIVLMLIVSNQVLAGFVNQTKIKELLIGKVYGDIVFIETETRPTLSSGHCADNASYSYVFDISTDVGKATLSIALAAYASKSPVYINGYDTCDLYEGVEDLRQIRLQ